jgi:hypothetical protein
MPSSSEQVARIVRKCLERGGTVEIDGLGIFQPDAGRGFTFVPQTRPKVFLAYVIEDAQAADRLHDALAANGFDPWMDRKKLLPGQNWQAAIERAIPVSDFFVACFSQRALDKRGRFYSELRCALDCASRLPLEDVFFIPVRLEDCALPARIAREFQYVDLFTDWERGFGKIVAAMRRQVRARRKRELSLTG